MMWLHKKMCCLDTFRILKVFLRILIINVMLWLFLSAKWRTFMCCYFQFFPLAFVACFSSHGQPLGKCSIFWMKIPLLRTAAVLSEIDSGVWTEHVVGIVSKWKKNNNIIINQCFELKGSNSTKYKLSTKSNTKFFSHQ